MPETAQESGFQPRLLRIDLPGVKVENRRSSFETVDSVYAPARPRVRQYAEISATGDR